MIAEKPWRLEAVLLLGAGLLMSMAVGGLAVSSLQHFLPDVLPTKRQFVAFLVSAFTFHGMALVFVHQFLGLHGTSWRTFLGTSVQSLPRVLTLACVIGILVVPVALILNRLCAEALSALSVEPVEQQPVKIIQVSAGLFQRTCSAVAAVLLAPIAEEILFRGILYPVIKQRGFPRLAVWGTSLLFALIHNNLMTFIPLTALSIVLIALYERTDVLLAPIVTHGLFNAINFALLVLEPEALRWN